MTCYMRHLQGVFDLLGLENDATGRRRLDTAIRETFGFGDEAHCPEIWATIKPLPAAAIAEAVAPALDGTASG